MCRFDQFYLRKLQHDMAKWLVVIQKLHSPFTVSLTRLYILISLEICSDNKLLESFDIVNYLGHGLISDLIVNVMHLATGGVEFSFDNNMHAQIDGVSI